MTAAALLFLVAYEWEVRADRLLRLVTLASILQRRTSLRLIDLGCPRANSGATLLA